METDGSIEPEQALRNAAEIIADHFKIIAEVDVPETKGVKLAKPPKRKKEPKTKKKNK